MHLTTEERTNRVRKRPMVETTQNHLKISKKKIRNQQSKKQILIHHRKRDKQIKWVRERSERKRNTARERKHWETLPNTKRESYHQKDRTTTEVVMIVDGRQWLNRGRKGKGSKRVKWERGEGSGRQHIKRKGSRICVN